MSRHRGVKKIIDEALDNEEEDLEEYDEGMYYHFIYILRLGNITWF